MCYNSSISLNTFIFGIIALIIIYFNNKNIIRPQVLLIVFSLTLIQLLEYYAWIYINDEEIIRILSLIGLGIIGLQIILINYILLTGKIRLISFIFMLIFFILFAIFQFPKINFNMEKGENGHLIWYWLDLPLIWILIALSFYLIPLYVIRNKSLLAFIFVSLILIISFYYYYKYKTWGTMWCYFSNLIWLYLLIYVIIKRFGLLKKNKF
jgi:hypothetical protein